MRECIVYTTQIRRAQRNLLQIAIQCDVDARMYCIYHSHWPNRSNFLGATLTGNVFIDICQSDCTSGRAPQSAPERPTARQSAPEHPRAAQSTPKQYTRAAHNTPERPRKPQSAPERHRAPQIAPDRPRTRQSATEFWNALQRSRARAAERPRAPQSAPERHGAPRFQPGLLQNNPWRQQVHH